MSITINKNIARGLNTLGYWVGTLFSILLDNSYPAGGYTFAAKDIKLGVIEYIAPFVAYKGDFSAVILGIYDSTNGKLRFYNAGASAAQAGTLLVKGAQAAGIALQVDVDSNAAILGKTTAGDITLSTTIGGLGSLEEVGTGTDLSTYTAIGLAFGKG